MNKSQNIADNDVTTESYKGPSVTTAIAGEGYIAHFKWAAVGLFVGGVVSAFLHVPLLKIMGSARNGSEGLRRSGTALREEGRILLGSLKNVGGSLGGWVFGRGEKEFLSIREAISNSGAPVKNIESSLNMIDSKEKGVGHWLADHALALFFVPAAKRRAIFQHSGQVEAAAIGGGLLGSIGFFCSPWLYAGQGYKKGTAGKEQFSRLQDEVVTTRAERDALRSKYIDTQIELDTIKATHQKGTTLEVARDNPPSIEPAHEDSTALLNGVDADSPTHPTAPTIGPAPTTGRTLPGEPPRIQEPTIGPEHAEGWAERLHARDSEAAAYHDAVR